MCPAFWWAVRKFGIQRLLSGETEAVLKLRDGIKLFARTLLPCNPHARVYAMSRLRANMDGFRLKELQAEFVALREEWMAGDSTSERQLLMGRIIDILHESTTLVERIVRKRLTRCISSGQQSSDACADTLPGKSSTARRVRMVSHLRSSRRRKASAVSSPF